MIDDISQPVKKNKYLASNILPEKFYKFAFKQLRNKLEPKRLLLSAGGDAFAKAMTRILNHPVQVFPLPVQHDLPAISPKRLSAGESPLIVVLGHTCARKGSELIGPILRKVLGKHNSCHCFLQANPVCWGSRWKDEIGMDLISRVCVHSGEMTQDEYQESLSRADLVLLPYIPEKYLLLTSGVFSEAMAMGKVSVIPDGTWMADMVHKYGGGGVIYPRHDVEVIIEAILKALQHLPQLTHDMQDISSEWRESMGMKSYLQKILDAVVDSGKRG
jgi:glycosyltransferase involved in cell wall biosynthesis